MNSKIKRLLYPAAFLVLMILPMSCASAPETPVEEAVETAAPVEEISEASGESAAAAKALAETAREKAIKAKAPKAVKDLFEEGVYANAVVPPAVPV